MTANRDIPIGDRLRRHRIEVLQKTLRAVAKELDVSPPYIVDLEKGNRRPSEDLLVRMAKVYQLPEADLRAGFSRAPAVVEQIASQDSVTVEKVPEFLRTAKDFTPEQWDRLIAQAKKMKGSGKGKRS